MVHSGGVYELTRLRFNATQVGEAEARARVAERERDDAKTVAEDRVRACRSE